MDDDFGTYNGDTMHDMWVDYTYQEYTGELDGWYGGTSNGNRHYGYYRTSSRSKFVNEQICDCKSRIKQNQAKIERIKARMEVLRQKLENPNLSHQRSKSLSELVNKTLPSNIKIIETEIQQDEENIIALKMTREKNINAWAIAFSIASVFIAFLIMLAVFK